MFSKPLALYGAGGFLCPAGAFRKHGVIGSIAVSKTAGPGSNPGVSVSYGLIV